MGRSVRDVPSLTLLDGAAVTPLEQPTTTLLSNGLWRDLVVELENTETLNPCSIQHLLINFTTCSWSRRLGGNQYLIAFLVLIVTPDSAPNVSMISIGTGTDVTSVERDNIIVDVSHFSNDCTVLSKWLKNSSFTVDDRFKCRIEFYFRKPFQFFFQGLGDCIEVQVERFADNDYYFWKKIRLEDGGYESKT